MSAPYINPMSGLAGKHLLVLNWRDIRHKQAGGAEEYMHQISRRWVGEGIKVTWFTSRDAGQSAFEIIDGVGVVRGGGTLSVYLHAAMRLLKERGAVDAVVDCQNGIPFFSPLFLKPRTPVVQVVHHVHQDQFRTRFSPPMAAFGRYLEGSVAKSVYGPRAIAAVSPSTRLELRKLGYGGPIHIVPNGTADVPETVGPRDPDPTVTVVSRLVPHKRIDTLLGQVAVASKSIPNLRVEIVGDGPERERLEHLAMDLDLDSTVTFHGFQPDDVRNSLLNRAWLTMCTSDAEGWGLSVIEAAAWGVPCLALHVPGVRDSVVDGTTGWLVNAARDLGAALVDRLTDLADPGQRSRISAACQEWARCFTWERSASLLAGVVGDESERTGGQQKISRHRGVRSDMATVARFWLPDDADLSSILGGTDEVAGSGTTAVAILKGRDEYQARAALRRLGVQSGEVWAATRTEILAGPTMLLEPQGSTLAEAGEGR